MKKKNCYIRCCDHDWEWDVCSGNSDALCNEDSRNIDCALCHKNVNCQFSNYPYFDEKKYIQSEDPEYFYLNLTYEFDYKAHRKSLRNTELCKKCVYNHHYEWIKLTIKEERAIKLKKLNENR
jgi:hypothetical protein